MDISHDSDKTFYDALEIAKAYADPSHSSCRALCNHVRDMSDDMIKALAAKGGVIQVCMKSACNRPGRTRTPTTKKPAVWRRV